MTPRLAIRIGLGYLTLVALQIGVWALLAPRSFYDDFPGMGRSWVSADGPYNEHLVRDVGALNLALAALLLVAAFRLRRDLVRIAAIASLVWSVPHFLYHATTTDRLPAGDAIVSLGGLGIGVVFAALLFRSARHLDVS